MESIHGLTHTSDETVDCFIVIGKYNLLYIYRRFWHRELCEWRPHLHREREREARLSFGLERLESTIFRYPNWCSLFDCPSKDTLCLVMEICSFPIDLPRSKGPHERSYEECFSGCFIEEKHCTVYLSHWNSEGVYIFSKMKMVYMCRGWFIK